MPGRFVSSAILQGASALIRSRGREAAAIAQSCGIPVAALEDADLLVSGRAVLRFFEAAADQCTDRTLGLELAARARLAVVLGPLWILLRNARTVREMCEELAVNFDLYSDAALMSFEMLGEGDGLLGWSAASDQIDSEVQMAEYALGLIAAQIRTQSTADWMPKAALFRHAAPSNLRLHRLRFGGALRFNQDRNALLLDAATLAQSLQSRSAQARALVRSVVREDETGVALSVERIVRTLMPFAPCGIRDVALAMGLPPRTLQAHLQNERATFNAIKDRVRADLAFKYLQHSNMSIGQIAETLGYGDPTSFSRSFSRWHGKTAQAMRRARKRGTLPGH
ncbi:MAG: AraC family transcriptional regulator [Nevskia sp.]